MSVLGDITVVALEQAVAAPLASRHLADWGARVIKIERPGAGDFARGYDRTVKGLSSHFVWLNRSKQSLTLDIKASAGQDVLSRLLDRADVFIQNLAPGALTRLGFSAEEVRAKRPRLIVCNVSGYGEQGPYRDRKAYDLLVQAEAGLLSITGTEQTPSKPGISVADIAAGMYAYSGILTALLRRTRTGEGGVVDVSLFDALGEWMSYPAYFAAYGGVPPARTGAHHATIAPYGPVTAADERTLMIGLQNEREWESFCRYVLERPDLVGDARFVNNHARHRNRDQLDEVIMPVLEAVASDELVSRLERAGVAYSRMNTMQEFVDHPQLSARNRWQEVASPAGSLRVLLPPVDLGDEPPHMEAIPDVGEHTDAILEWLGLSADAIGTMRREGAI